MLLLLLLLLQLGVLLEKVGWEASAHGIPPSREKMRGGGGDGVGGGSMGEGEWGGGQA